MKSYRALLSEVLADRRSWTANFGRHPEDVAPEMERRMLAAARFVIKAAAAAHACRVEVASASPAAAGLRQRLDSHAADGLSAGSVLLPPEGLWVEAQKGAVGIGLVAEQACDSRLISGSVWLFAPDQPPMLEPHVLVAQGRVESPLPIASDAVAFRLAEWIDPADTPSLMTETRAPIAEIAAHIFKVAIGARLLPPGKARTAMPVFEDIGAEDLR